MSGSYQGSKSKGWSESGSTPEEIYANYMKYLPQVSQMNLSMIPQFNRAMSSAGLEGVTGAGGASVKEAAKLATEINPALAASMEATKTASGDVAAINEAARKGIGAVNLEGLSPGEYNAAERALNQSNTRTGNLGLINPMNTISNAMNFGGAFNNKLGLYDRAVNTGANAANLSSGISGQFANTANTMSNATSNVLGSANPYAGQAASSTLGLSGMLQQMAAGTKSVGQTISSGSGGSAGCCFIFLESYHGTLPTCVRKFRDRYYRLRPDIATGYKKMAKWLVPLMQKSSIIRNAVWYLMVKPATSHCSHPKHNLNKTISRFWLNLWSFYGRS